MKKAIQTLFQFQSWQLTLMVVFAWCFVGIQNADAQVKIKYTANRTTSVSHTLSACSGSPDQFTDDGSIDGIYGDGHMRRDTIELCPVDAWSRLKVVFTDFDVATGDTLDVYQGNKAAVRAGSAIGAGSGSGTGVAAAFGGWIDANCDPAVNPSGCLTFIFRTNGDNNKGAGWDAWVDCETRGITVAAPNITSVKLACNESAYGLVSIPAPTVSSTCGVVGDSVLFRIKNQHGNVCKTGRLSQVAGLGVGSGTGTGLYASWKDTFAIGNYIVEFKLRSDSMKTASASFSVQAPALVCNDNISVPIGSACMVILRPDDILEQSCDTITDTMYYNITITLGTGKDVKVIETSGHDDGGAVSYPIITSDLLKAAKVSACGGTASVKIERIYYGRNGTNSLATLCNNGPQSLSCTTTLNFYDDAKPWVDITAAPDTLIACDTTGLAAMLNAKGIDNCDTEVPVTFTVTLEEDDPCFSKNGSKDTTKATITFFAADDCGNVGTATHVVTMIRPDIKDARFIAKTVNILAGCKDTPSVPTPQLRVGVWKNNAFQVKDSVSLSTEEYICGYILVATDEDIPPTDCGKKKYRYWDVLDWCEPAQVPMRIDTTLIEHTDTVAPKFDAESIPASDLHLAHFECTYDITTLSKPGASDDCDDNPDVTMSKVERIEDGTYWAIAKADWTKLDCDSFRITWVAEDECHEQLKKATITQVVVIKDVTKPSAVCVDQLNVSLPNEEGARVCVDDIDAGSFDACGIAERVIRIKGSDDAWGECVEISCNYLKPDLQIEMRVTDNKGNQNICWSDLVIEDKIKPVCNDLEDKTAWCDDFHNDELGVSTDADGDLAFDDDEWQPLTGEILARYNKYFGAFTCEDNLKVSDCKPLTQTEEYQLIAWPCGELKIKRRHQAEDWAGNKSEYATQNIKINYREGWEFTLPDDWTGDCGDTEVSPVLTINNGACDLLGYEVTEKRFEIPGDACFKIERTYHIINWCKYVAGDNPVEISRVEGQHGFAKGFTVSHTDGGGAGYWTYVQVLKVHDNEGPVITVTDPDPCINGVDGDAAPYGEEDVSPGEAPYECDEVKTWHATATDCSDASAITWKAIIYDEDGKEVTSNDGSGADHSISTVVFNKEKYRAVFWAFDACGNSSETPNNNVEDPNPLIEFWDCKKPTPYVLNGLSVELMQTGMVQVWAKDLNRASFDNCTDQDDLKFRIYADHLGDAPANDEDALNLPEVLTFDCERIGTNTIQIYVIDEEGNWDFAVTYVIIQDNMGVCGGDPGGMAAGTIVNPDGENVESVTISVTGAAQESMTTGADGNFMFNLNMGEDYTVTPTKDINPLNGVSTFDLVLISKHILGISTFDSPYKHIAADVNKSGTITAFDMVQLRQLILNITTRFPNNDSWRFVDGAHQFSSANPAAEDFSEFYTISNMSTNMENLDFVGVKVGDVNGNAKTSSLMGAESRTTNGSLTFNVADRFVEAGQTVEVAFSSADIATAQGYQFTLNFAGLELAELKEGVAKAVNFNTNLANRGILTTSWNGEATADEVLFTLKFTATTGGQLSELVSVSSELTAAEAYNTAGDLLDVQLAFTNTELNNSFELGQNTPNPFRAETIIGFNLPQAGTATLKVMDVQGRILKQIEGEFVKGYNTVSINAKELGATGVLHYQLESADQVATKKMIIIE